ncbi:hypothetical protein NC796_15300 [Aliifodinibius sp. S!AR15-10]|uniref:phosphotriesterase family protein n=1 Tax=Aliifodinibius sp. S!AR15-10 TaxID=2950437 RepID=UPI00285AAB42|nr:hypothetical protein [Aliifodinibius sp. S!AR15-10]MDR8392520.1 hypothetical protein [Aliifodinibius sp. S!AR15-10]
MTVKGPVTPSALGTTLPHEHIMVDFIGADSVSKDRYDLDSVATMVKPFLQDFWKSGGQTLIECTPNYLGRDPALLKRLSEETGLNLLTNTGYYGDEKGQFLPNHVYEESAGQLAARWITEWKEGIGDTGVKPGFIKMRVDESPISETGQKLLHAAAQTHKASGLTIGVHTPDGATALEQLEILQDHGIDPSAFIWIHAQNEDDSKIHQEAAREGAWVEFDGIGPGSADYHFKLINSMRQDGLLDRVLISHDAGWYRVGQPGGSPGDFDPYTYIFEQFIPRLKRAGFTEEEIDMLVRENPQKAFTISVRTIES